MRGSGSNVNLLYKKAKRNQSVDKKKHLLLQDLKFIEERISDNFNWIENKEFKYASLSLEAIDEFIALKKENEAILNDVACKSIFTKIDNSLEIISDYTEPIFEKEERADLYVNTIWKYLQVNPKTKMEDRLYTDILLGQKIIHDNFNASLDYHNFQSGPIYPAYETELYEHKPGIQVHFKDTKTSKPLCDKKGRQKFSPIHSGAPVEKINCPICLQLKKTKKTKVFPYKTDSGEYLAMPSLHELQQKIAKKEANNIDQEKYYYSALGITRLYWIKAKKEELDSFVSLLKEFDLSPEKEKTNTIAACEDYLLQLKEKYKYK